MFSSPKRTLPQEDAYYGSQRPHHNNDNFLPNSHNAQISNLFKTLERHKAFLKSDPLFEKNIHDQIDAIAKSRISHDAHIKDLDERLAQYSTLLSRKNFRPNTQVPPGMVKRDLGTSRTSTSDLHNIPLYCPEKTSAPTLKFHLECVTLAQRGRRAVFSCSSKRVH